MSGIMRSVITREGAARPPSASASRPSTPRPSRTPRSRAEPGARRRESSSSSTIRMIGFDDMDTYRAITMPVAPEVQGCDNTREPVVRSTLALRDATYGRGNNDPGWWWSEAGEKFLPGKYRAVRAPNPETSSRPTDKLALQRTLAVATRLLYREAHLAAHRASGRGKERAMMNGTSWEGCCWPRSTDAPRRSRRRSTRRPAAAHPFEGGHAPAARQGGTHRAGGDPGTMPGSAAGILRPPDDVDAAPTAASRSARAASA